MKRRLGLALLVCSFVLLGCDALKGPAAQENVIQVEDIPRDIRMPTALWGLIEGSPPPTAAEQEEGSQDADAELMGTSNRTETLFMPLDVILTQKNEGVMKSTERVRIRLPRGGGRVDLADYLTDQQGSFFVSFAWPEVPEGQAVEAWYVSKARARKLDGELWGAGCRKFFRIKDAVQKAWSGEGLKVNTTRFRHLSVLGGHFVFSSRQSRQVFVSQVTFTDSRATNLLCEAL